MKPSPLSTIINHHCVCRRALQAVLGWGEQQWQTCQKSVQTGIVPVHKNKGRPSNRGLSFRRNVVPAIEAFLQRQEDSDKPMTTTDQEPLSNNQPQPLTAVTNSVSNIAADESTKEKQQQQSSVSDESPSQSSVRRLYKDFCKERGYDTTYDWQGRTFQQPTPNRDTPPLEVCSHRTFCNYILKRKQAAATMESAADEESS